LFIGSKIQFSESKSQQPKRLQCSILCCLSVQRYNFLKANHNRQVDCVQIIQVVYRFKDTIF